MEKRKISAKIIADSINPSGQRITTFVLVMPRIILAEFNTHRMFSRNSASSRAIPFSKMLESVEQDPFIPIKWMKDHSGMQGNEYFTEPSEIQECKENWLEAKNNAILYAGYLNDQGLTKQIVNRLLEPFLWHTVIVTATDFENFFALRAHEAAEIHIQELAYRMLEAYNNYRPISTKIGRWHIPFGNKIDLDRLEKDLHEINYVPKLILNGVDFLTTAKIEIATARCARVSYMNFEGEDDYKKDLALYAKLSTMGQWSPFEHCAASVEEGYNGNFNGWLQLRKGFQDENKKDHRI